MAWRSMKTRCLNKNHPVFKHYGGRGITVCDSWLKFENFRDDMFKTWKQDLQLDRINVNGNYELNNCRWVTASENTRNRRCKSEIQSRIKGVHWNKHRKRWIVQVVFDSQKEAEIFALINTGGK